MCFLSTLTSSHQFPNDFHTFQQTRIDTVSFAESIYVRVIYREAIIYREKYENALT